MPGAQEERGVKRIQPRWIAFSAAPAPKRVKGESGAREVIVIDDDDDNDGGGLRRQTLPEGAGGAIKRQHDEQDSENERIARSILENLREQVADLAMRHSQLEWTSPDQWKETVDSLKHNEDANKAQFAELTQHIQTISARLDHYTQVHNVNDNVKQVAQLTRRIQALEAAQAEADNANDSDNADFLHNVADQDVLGIADRRNALDSLNRKYSPGDLDVERVKLRLMARAVDEYFMRPVLANGALARVLQTTDFGSLAQLRALKFLDTRAAPRDAVLFCDSASFAMFQVDYMLRGGPSASYIADHPSVSPFLPGSPSSSSFSSSYPDVDGVSAAAAEEALGGPDEVAEWVRRTRRLAAAGLAGCRVLELDVRLHEPTAAAAAAADPAAAESERKVFAWWRARHRPPRYVYDLGQLFLRRKGQDRFDLLPTKYNLVVDIAAASNNDTSTTTDSSSSSSSSSDDYEDDETDAKGKDKAKKKKNKKKKKRHQYRPIWLAMRPEHAPPSSSPPTKDRHSGGGGGSGGRQDSTQPFRTRGADFGEGQALARVADGFSLSSLSSSSGPSGNKDHGGIIRGWGGFDDFGLGGRLVLGSAPFAADSAAAFYRAGATVHASACGRGARLRFRVPDLDEMLAAARAARDGEVDVGAARAGARAGKGVRVPAKTSYEK
ncbi:hypothetical protein GGR56DRAFT_671799 [Xylariaceae sp. FL0804]|nr:hypothetical protein GGR56DRAFT_671799 [Xylariaceae sp. FL0804]